MRMIVLFFSMLFFQYGLSQKVYVGVKAGEHVGSAFIEHTIHNLNLVSTFSPGFHTGILVKYFPLNENAFLKSGIQFGANYVRKGWVQSFPNNEPDYKITMNYMEVPIEGIGYFGNKNKYFITVGFYVEYLLSHEKDADPNLDNLRGQDFYTYERDRDREIGYGGRASAGVFRDLSFGALHLEGFFAYSFSNFINANNLLDETPDLSNLWTTGISLGYFFQLGK